MGTCPVGLRSQLPTFGVRRSLVFPAAVRVDGLFSGLLMGDPVSSKIRVQPNEHWTGTELIKYVSDVTLFSVVHLAIPKWNQRYVA